MSIIVYQWFLFLSRLVDGPDQFSFTGIPYAVPVVGAERLTHSR